MTMGLRMGIDGRAETMTTRNNPMTNLCIAPNEIQDGDLLAYVDGAASAVVTDHLGRCAACQADAAALAALDAELVAALFRAACPPTEDLLAYQVNLLGTGEQAQIRLHVQTCGHCQGELAELAAVPCHRQHPQPARPCVRCGPTLARRRFGHARGPACPAMAGR